MDVAPIACWSSKNYALNIGKKLSLRDQNQILYISALASEIRDRIGKLPVCEVRQLPDWKLAIHIMLDRIIKGFQKQKMRT
jgi:hypothetical protein